MKLTIETLPPEPFTRRQAVSWGVRPRHLEAAVCDRRLRRLFRGVYVRCDVDLTPLVRAQAAALVTGPDCVLRDRSAAWVLGVDVHRYAELDLLPELEVCVLRGHNPTHLTGMVGGSRDLLPLDWIEIGGVKVTTPLRTAMDLGCVLTRRNAMAAMDCLMRLYRFTVQDLSSQLPRYFRRRGVIQLRQLVPLVDGRAESQRESWTRLEILDHGLPAPDVQYLVEEAGVAVYRLDLAYPRSRICVEYDGAEFHSSVEQRRHDERRREWLRQRGWHIIIVSKDSFTDQALRAWIGELSTHLTERTRRPAPAYRWSAL